MPSQENVRAVRKFLSHHYIDRNSHCYEGILHSKQAKTFSLNGMQGNSNGKSNQLAKIRTEDIILKSFIFLKQELQKASRKLPYEFSKEMTLSAVCLRTSA